MMNCYHIWRGFCVKTCCHIVADGSIAVVVQGMEVNFDVCPRCSDGGNKEENEM